MLAFYRLRILLTPTFDKEPKNWKPYILNAFDCSYSNAFTEGCNNAIKALKRVAFGFRNFSNFRARILQAANPAHPNF